MKTHRVLALMTVSLLVTNSAWSDTFLPTSGSQFWNINPNWDTNAYPDSPGALATLPAPTGSLTIDLGEEITIGSLTINKSVTVGQVADVTLTGSPTNRLVFEGGGSLINAVGSGTGLTTITAPILLNSTLTVSQSDTSALQFLGEISGSGGLNLNRAGSGGAVTRTVVLGAANSYIGPTILTGSTGNQNQNYLLVRLDDAGSIPAASNITLQNAVVLGLTAGSGDFTRGLGSGPGEWHNGLLPADGGADAVKGLATGWAAFGVDRAVNIGGNATPNQLFWGNGAGPSDALQQNILVLGHTTADKTIEFKNPIILNSGGGNTSPRTFRIIDGAAAVDATISGALTTVDTNNSRTDVEFIGGGTVSLTAANTYHSEYQLSPLRIGTAISGGTVVILNHPQALSDNTNLRLSGNGVLGLGTGNDSFTRPLGDPSNLQTGQIQFTGTDSGGGGFAAFGSSVNDVKVVNLGGAGATVTWDVAPFITGNGNLTLADGNSVGTLEFQNGIDLGAAGNDRTILVGGGSSPIDARVSGVISGAGNLRKNQPGTLEVSNANTYTGTTLINAGVLLLTNQFSIPGGIEGGNTNNIVFTATNENTIGVLGLGERNFTTPLGTGAGQVNLGTHGGFAAFFADRAVNLGGSGQQVVWGSTPGFATGVLQLSVTSADATLDFQNAVDLNGAARTVKTPDGTAEIDGKLSGVISGSGSLVKDGGGALAVTAANTYTGGTSIIQGRLLANNGTGSAVGSGDVTLTGGSLGGSGFVGTAADASNVTVSGTARIAPGSSANNAGELTIFGDVAFSESTTSFDVEMAGLTAGIQYDRLRVLGGQTNGAAALNGTLNVILLDEFMPSPGDSFTILTAQGGVSGTFSSLNLPVLTGGIWSPVQYNSGSVVLSVAAGLAGDYNSDGTVDAADYVLWRKSPGSFGGDPAGYNAWRANFGNSAGSGSSLHGGNVPEPPTFVLVCLIVPFFASRKLGWIRAGNL